jgi:hypothetical protein
VVVGEVKCWLTYMARYYKEIPLDERIQTAYYKVRFDGIHDAGAKVIETCHCSIDEYGAIHFDGSPFWLPIVNAEVMRDTKARIGRLVRASREIVEYQLKSPKTLSMSDRTVADNALLSEMAKDDDQLLLVHKREERKQLNGRRRNLAIKIYH